MSWRHSVPVSLYLIALVFHFSISQPKRAESEEAPLPKWIWVQGESGKDQQAAFRYSFELDTVPSKAELLFAADNGATAFLNGEMLAENRDWATATREDARKLLRKGKNVLAFAAKNEDGPAGLIVELVLTAEDGVIKRIQSGNSWKAATPKERNWLGEFDDSGWRAASEVGAYGDAPWGKIVLRNAPPVGIEATMEDQITVPSGFEVQLLYSVPKSREGSWVCLTSDDRGRLLACDQYGALYRVTPGEKLETTKVEKLDVEIGEAQGLLYAYDALYVVVNGGAAQGSGLYRVTDTNHDDQFDHVELLKSFEGAGEHGPHAVKLGPDGRLYVIAGNFTKIPEGSDKNSSCRHWGEDQLLPRNPDGGGHDPQIMAPAGWFASCNRDGRDWRLISMGMRNAYDFDFNADGEAFTFDSDMEWDTGTPWYRPTRVNHLVSGGEYGWRNGTGKWPEYYEDSLGAVVNIGLGSPTGVSFGYGAKFPGKYQNAFYICDWSYGKVYACHIRPQGASYTADFEVFIQGRPLPLTDLIVHTDGAMYFTIGGRRTQSGLYRVRYIGKDATSVGPATVLDKGVREARAVRHGLEGIAASPERLDSIWKRLGDADRSIRYTARVALEGIPTAEWRARIQANEKPMTLVQGAIALARTGESSDRGRIVEALSKLPFSTLSETQFLGAIRAMNLAFIRLGAPNATEREKVLGAIRPQFPHQSDFVSRELCQLLVYLQEPTTTPIAMKLLANAPSQEEQLYYVLALRNAKDGWTPELREAYFSWMNLAQSSYRGGHSFQKFIDRIRDDAVKLLPESEKSRIKTILEGKDRVQVVKLETTRQFVHNWQVSDLLPKLNTVNQGRSFENGLKAYQATQCAKCHRFAGQGGDTGPDITGVGARFSPQYILESLVQPSLAISDQYMNHVIVTTDGDTVVGRVLEDTATSIKVRTDPFATKIREIPKSSIEERRPSKVSEMPEGLINTLTEDEVLDLIAYLRSAGNRSDRAFQP